MPTPSPKHLPRDGGRVIVERIQDAEFQPVHAGAISEIVVELLLRDSRLRHAKTAKRACRHQIGMHGAG